MGRAASPSAVAYGTSMRERRCGFSPPSRAMVRTCSSWDTFAAPAGIRGSRSRDGT